MKQCEAVKKLTSHIQNLAKKWRITVVQYKREVPPVIIKSISNMLNDYVDISELELSDLLAERKHVPKEWYSYSDVAKILLCTKRHVINLIQANPDVEVHYCGARSPRLNRKGVDALITCRPRHPANKDKVASA